MQASACGNCRGSGGRRDAARYRADAAHLLLAPAGVMADMPPRSSASGKASSPYGSLLCSRDRVRQTSRAGGGPLPVGPGVRDATAARRGPRTRCSGPRTRLPKDFPMAATRSKGSAASMNVRDMRSRGWETSGASSCVMYDAPQLAQTSGVGYVARSSSSLPAGHGLPQMDMAALGSALTGGTSVTMHAQVDWFGGSPTGGNGPEMLLLDGAMGGGADLRGAMAELDEMRGLSLSDTQDSWRFAEAQRRPTTAPIRAVTAGNGAGSKLGKGGAVEATSGLDSSIDASSGATSVKQNGDTAEELQMRLSVAENVMRKLYRQNGRLEQRLVGTYPQRPHTAAVEGGARGEATEACDSAKKEEHAQALFLLQQKESDLQQMRDYTSQATIISSQLSSFISPTLMATHIQPWNHAFRD